MLWSKDTALKKALRNNNIIRVQSLLLRGADPNLKFEAQPAIVWATVNGRVEIVNALLHAGVNINTKDEFGWTPIMWAILLGNKEIILNLLSQNAEVNVFSTKYNISPLRIACYLNDFYLIKTLLLKGAKVDSNDDLKYIDLKYIPGPQPTDEEKEKIPFDLRSRYGQPTLVWATQEDQTEIVLALLDNGADVNAKDRDGFTALMWAVQNGNIKIVETLFRKGHPDVNAKTKSFQITALNLAVKNGNGYMFNFLLRHNADVNTINHNGATVLKLAVQENRYEFMNSLLDRGADIEHQDNDGWNALMIGAREGHMKITQCLLEHGADRTKKNKRGLTASIIAKNHGHEEIHRLLL